MKIRIKTQSPVDRLVDLKFPRIEEEIRSHALKIKMETSNNFWTKDEDENEEEDEGKLNVVQTNDELKTTVKNIKIRKIIGSRKKFVSTIRPKAKDDFNICFIEHMKELFSEIDFSPGIERWKQEPRWSWKEFCILSSSIDPHRLAATFPNSSYELLAINIAPRLSRLLNKAIVHKDLKANETHERYAEWARSKNIKLLCQYETDAKIKKNDNVELKAAYSIMLALAVQKSNGFDPDRSRNFAISKIVNAIKLLKSEYYGNMVGDPKTVRNSLKKGVAHIELKKRKK